MSKVDTFDNQLSGIVNRERQQEYGHPLGHFTRSATMKAQVQSCPDLALKHALEMILDKVARLAHNPEHFDSWLDIAGYARTACMVLDARSDDDET
jgi:hypothetical protein